MTDSNLGFPLETRSITHRSGHTGLLIAVCIMSLWIANLSLLLRLNLTSLPVGLIVLAIFWQMFLYTGLFITGHDAMHGSVCPQKPRFNHWIGSLTVFCFGAFSYREVLKKHWQHHLYPASSRDPDFHDGNRQNILWWYFRFMGKYWGWSQFWILSAMFQFAHYVLGISQINLFLFWVIPPILSSVQLFYFGTFLTHREPEAGYTNTHRAETLPLSTFWSFITCYHFGYHQEHHEYPQMAWWQLPVLHQLKTDGAVRDEMT